MVQDPTVLYQPWVAHHFPGLTPTDMELIRWGTYISMWDSIKEG